MWKSKNVVLGICGVILILFLAEFFYFYKSRAAVASIRINNLEVFGHKGEVVGGKIYLQGREISPFLHPVEAYDAYRLANFYKISLEDPLFVDQNLAPDSYIESVSYLQSINDKLKIEYSLSDDVIPVNFLAEVGKLDKLYLDFLANPSLERAENLNQEGSRVAILYKSSVQTLNKGIDDNNPKDSQAAILGTVTNRKTADSDLSLMVQNAEELARQINKRQLILDGVVFSSSLPKISDPKFTPNPPNNNLLLLPELSLGSDVQGPVRGPYVASTKCYDRFGQDTYFYLYDINYYDGKQTTLPKVATENYYRAVADGQGPNKVFLDQGYKWQPEREGNVYMCKDNEFQPQLLALDYFYNHDQKPILSDLLDSQTFSALKSSEKAEIEGYALLEKQFYEDKYKSLTNARAMAAIYQNVYLILGDTSSEKDDIQFALLDRSQLLKNSLTSVQDIFNGGFELNNFLFLDSLLQQPVNKKNVAGYLFFSRSNYSLEFLNFSPATYRLSQKPEYLRYQEVSKNVFETFSDLVKVYGKNYLLELNKLNQKAVFNMIGIDQK